MPLLPSPLFPQEYCVRAAAAQDLDTLISAHEAYLDTMLTKVLLDG